MSHGSNLPTHIADFLKPAAANYEVDLRRWNPWHGDNDITERNVTFQVARAFCAKQGASTAFMEVPFANAGSTRKRHHLDARLSDATYCYLFEAKTASGQKKLRWSFEDMDRIDHYAATATSSSPTATSPLRTVGLVVVETWYDHIASWWTGSHNLRPKWQDAIKPAQYTQRNWCFNVLQVGDFTGCKGIPERDHPRLQWLVAHKEF